ncbi:AsmA-like C-terminal region-containing protein [Variovorax sp. PAMC26660]|uniref:AsmA-like C-terminal region-containing protein n=1 Tax=Variovorax sp. PAMC26660 TaxID=2762322 RepID=UPI00164E18F6|nr:AsmA-like C-terminal region-containing protein [Variovorax sp. PAMC26660]QNK70402.1 hypothetical protein H7F35_12260 [Variovorax sp. PAMC26660]
MKRPLRHWLIGTAAVLLLGVGVLVLVVRAKLPTDAEVAAQISAAFEKRFGVALKVGGARWSLLPAPALVLTDIATDQARPITLRQVSLQLKLGPLLHRVIAVDEVEVDSLVLPRASVQAFRGKGPKPAEGSNVVALPTPWTLAPIPVELLRWRDVVWIDRRDIALAYDGEITFDPEWRPRQARVERAGVSPPVRLRLDREAGQDRWRTRIDAGGGTGNGVMRFETLADGKLRVSAELEPRQVDIEGLLQAFDRRSALAGKVSGRSTLVAEADEVGALVRSLHTRTTFSVQPATLTKLDIAKAVTTAGISRGGRTALDELTGTLDTQGTADGVVMQYSNLKARSGVLSASGNLRLFNRKLDGEVAVDLVDGVVGVPLKIGGTVSDPELSLTGAALTGAAIGSAVLPGVGTAIGARVGQQVEKLFGGGKPEKPAPRKQRTAPASAR